jgi:hypothetical protein
MPVIVPSVPAHFTLCKSSLWADENGHLYLAVQGETSDVRRWLEALDGQTFTFACQEQREVEAHSGYVVLRMARKVEA